MKDTANSLFEYIRTKTFFKHTLFALITLIVLMFGLLQFVNSFTDHGEFIEVPDFSGIKTNDIDKFVADKLIRYQIIDSVYNEEMPRGVVIEQTPSPEFHVKENRTIYLTVNAVLPPQIKMPNLVDASLRQATALLESYGLKLGNISYVPDYAQNAVLEQRYKGRKIVPGSSLARGSVINLVLGKGVSDEEVSIPYVIGQTRKQALEAINLAMLSVGAEVFNEKVNDSSAVFVYRQTPMPSGEKLIKSGSAIDLFYTSDEDKVKIDSSFITTENKNPEEN